MKAVTGSSSVLGRHVGASVMLKLGEASPKMPGKEKFKSFEIAQDMSRQGAREVRSCVTFD